VAPSAGFSGGVAGRTLRAWLEVAACHTLTERSKPSSRQSTL
jgi:hypothetical protein